MSDVEERLREALTRHARAAPVGDRMLSQVRWESGRRRRRRRSAIAGGLAAALVLTVLGVAALTGEIADSRETLQTVEQPYAEDVGFVDGSAVDITFPFSPTGPLLDGPPPVLSLVAGRPTLSYEQTTLANGPTTVTVGDSPWAGAAPAPSTKGQRVTVRGRSGTIQDRRTTDGQIEHVLSWPEGSGQWVEIDMPASASTDALTRFAMTLTARPMIQPGPFGFDVVPDGFTIDNVNASTVTFCPPSVAPSAEFAGKITIMLDAAQPVAPGAQPLTIDGRTGWISTADDTKILLLDGGDGRWLTVQVPKRLRVSDLDLLRFASGIHPTASAVPAQG